VVVYISNESPNEVNINTLTMPMPVKIGQNVSLLFSFDASGAAVGGLKLAGGQDIEISLVTADGNGFLAELTLP
jgi:hypothetical protein